MQAGAFPCAPVSVLRSCISGIGARRVEISEDHKIYSQSCVYFKAGSTPTSSHRRTLSVGPGLHLDHELDHELEHEYDDESDHSSELEHSEERRGRHPARGERGRPPVRRLSVDQTHYHTDIVSQHNEQLPTPPYSPMYSPVMTPVHRSPVPSRAPSIITPIYSDDSPRQSHDDFRRIYPERAQSSEYLSKSSPLARVLIYGRLQIRMTPLRHHLGSTLHAMGLSRGG